MGLDRPIDITAKERKTVLALLARYLPNTTAWVYGSRVKWTSRPESDLDLVVFTMPEQAGRVTDLREAFEESNLPFRVDLFVWDDVPEQFRKQIEAEQVVLVEREDRRMPSEWIAATIDDIVASSRNALVGGPFGSNLVSRDYVSEGVPVIRGQNMGTRWATGDFVFVTPQKAKSLKANLARPGDIVLTQRGTLGQVSIVPTTSFSRYLVSQSQMKVTLNREIADPLFFYYVLSSSEQQDYVRQNAIQTGVPHTNLGILRSTPVPLPPLPEQQAIAHILGTLDDKIELNGRMNQTLEERARALFKSWFVDFDPVQAKATLKQHEVTPSQVGSNWRVERARAYLDRMDPDIATLFPDSFVDSELGPIPAGWEVGTLGDVLCQRLERCRASEETASCPYVPIDCISPKSLYLTESKTGKEAKSSLTKFYTGDLVFGAMRPYYHKVCIAPFDGTTRTTAFVLYPKQKHDFAFATLLLCDSDTIDFATRNSTGSTIPYAAWTDSLETMPTIIPTPSVLRAFNHTVRPLLVRIPQPYFESRTLAALRDALLPKLMSGEVYVGETNKLPQRTGA